ncbi:MAG TPA: TetR/AcrR family transcriptional regulator [Fimbriimonadaceae bacterium]|nr:TetR/AcrR family transcriptional regulator [Fimbriimonadaceae bacterium]
MSRKDQILEASYDIVGEEGLEGLHARTVAQRLGINHAAVHYYFRTRSDLIYSLAKYAIDRFFAEQDEMLGKAASPQERIDALVSQVKSYSSPDSPFVRNWLSFFIAGITDAQLRELLGDHLVRWCEVLEQELEKEGNSVAIPLLNPRALLATLIGVMVVGQLDRQGDVSTDVDELSSTLKQFSQGQNQEQGL